MYMFKQKYKIGQNAPWKKQSESLLCLLIVVLTGAYLSTFLGANDHIHSLIEGVAFGITDVICYCTFVCIQMKYIQKLVSENKDILMFDYSAKKFEMACVFSRVLRFATWSICIIDGFIIVFAGSNRLAFSHSMLITQILFFCAFISYKAYYLDLITAFTDEGYISGPYVIRYKEIDKLVEIRRVTGIQDIVIFFNIFQNRKKVGYDRFTLSDYKYLCQHIKNEEHR